MLDIEKIKDIMLRSSNDYPYTWDKYSLDTATDDGIIGDFYSFVVPRLKEALRLGLVGITFIKKDSTERKMICTLNEKYLPKKEETASNTTRKKNDEILVVYSVEDEAWRSLRYDSIIDVWKLDPIVSKYAK